MTEKYTYSAEREIRTYAYLCTAAYDALEKASNIKEGSLYQTMSSLIFSAFALEAYLNHVGEKKLEFWNDIERIKPLSKLRVLYVYLGLDFDTSKRPIQTVIQVFKFRNFMAHGKTEKVEGKGTIKTPTRNSAENLVEAEWEKFCNQKEAERAFEDVKIIIKTLCEAAGFDVTFLFSLGNGSYHIERGYTPADI